MADKKTTKWTEPLKTWRTLVDFLRVAKEAEVWKLLEYELKNKKRFTIALRLYGKASELRASREKKQLVSELGA